MKVTNTYIVTVQSTGIIGNYTSVLYECRVGFFKRKTNWYLLSSSTFGPGTIFSGLNNLIKISEKDALKLIEETKK